MMSRGSMETRLASLVRSLCELKLTFHWANGGGSSVMSYRGSVGHRLTVMVAAHLARPTKTSVASTTHDNILHNFGYLCLAYYFFGGFSHCVSSGILIMIDETVTNEAEAYVTWPYLYHNLMFYFASVKHYRHIVTMVNLLLYIGTTRVIFYDHTVHTYIYFTYLR